MQVKDNTFDFSNIIFNLARSVGGDKQQSSQNTHAVCWQLPFDAVCSICGRRALEVFKLTDNSRLTLRCSHYKGKEETSQKS